MSQRRLYIAAYDVANPKRLVRALRVLKTYATGRQKSVFECYLTPAERRALLAGMEAVMDPVEDRFFVMKLEQKGKVRTLGKAVPPEDPAWFYVG